MMSLFSRTRRATLLIWLSIMLLVCVSAGLAAYQWRRQHREQRNSAKLRELANLSLPHQSIPHPDWPQWRGPLRDGATLESCFRTEWPSNGPPLLWEKPVGAGHASVVVAKGRAFTTFRQSANEVVACWDAKSGREIWNYSYASSYQLEHGNGPRSTPAVDGDLVYTVSADGVMHCLKAFTENPLGELVWKKNLTAEFQAEVPKWGVSFSPLVDGDHVFIQPGGPNGNSLAALDKRTGEVVWKKQSDAASYSSPIAADIGGQRQILFFTADRLVGIDPRTGDLLWDHAWPSDQQCNIATPIIVQDYVFISSGHGQGCALLKIDRTGKIWQPTVVYSHRRLRNHFSTCVRHKDHLYGFDHGVLVCMNFRTGAIEWKERGFDKGTVLLVNDHLVIHGETGIVALAEATPEQYREKSRFVFSTSGACWCVPVMVGGQLYLRDQKRIACFNVGTVNEPRP